ncbi:hypothetical protein N7463_008221 [Penicillium fimorum]|uniref:Uncharacterized protein n=1 Tax=Penicillium fimorum TaxID=1882269 RepID=A0A9W9XPY9_9EURO|nr:hypothetical protein N7463_008221 [Penicillium fimorum]
MDAWNDMRHQNLSKIKIIPESLINPLMSNSPTWNNPSLDHMVADLNHTFLQQPLPFDLP